MAAMQGQRGEGGIKIILFLVVLFYSIFAGIKIMTARADDASVKAKAEETIKFAGPQFYKGEDILYRVNKELKDRNAPIKPEAVKLTDEGKEWHLEFEYTRDVPLVVWTYKNVVKVDTRGPK